MSIQLNEDGTLDSFAWPGGYPLYYVTRNGDILCPPCAQARLVDDDTDANDRPTECEPNWEDPLLFCPDCSQRIESAYAEDDGFEWVIRKCVGDDYFYWNEPDGAWTSSLTHASKYTRSMRFGEDVDGREGGEWHELSKGESNGCD